MKTGRAFLCSVLSALLLLTFAIPAVAADSGTFTDDQGIRYQLIGAGEAAVAGWDASKLTTDTAVKIPEKVTIDGSEAKVTAVGENAFANCASINVVSLPVTVTKIGKSAFEKSSITGLTGADSVTSLGNSVFKDSKLAAVPSFSEELSEIPDYAFYNCTSMTGPVDLAAATRVGASAFYGCGITTIELLEATTIGNLAFASCKSLSSAETPSVTNIGANAFKDCKQLTELDKLTAGDSDASLKIGDAAFLRSGITEICTGMIASIGTNAFNECESLRSVCLNNAETQPLTIAGGAFAACKSLGDLQLPSSLTSMGKGALKDTPFDPDYIPEGKTQPQGVSQAKQIQFDGTETQWSKLAQGAGLTAFRVQWKGTDPGNNDWNPSMTQGPGDAELGAIQENDWIWFVDIEGDKPLKLENKDGTASTTAYPKSGQTLLLRAEAKRGELGFDIQCSKPSSAWFEVERDKVYISAANPGVGYGRSICEVPVVVKGRPGDTFDISLGGAYTYGGQSYTISKKLKIVIAGELNIVTAGQFQNVKVDQELDLFAEWGPPPDKRSAKFEWTCDPSGGAVTPTYQSGSNGEKATFVASKSGKYTVTCTGKGHAQDGTAMTDSKTVTVHVIENFTSTDPDKKPTISDGNKLQNMQPGDSTTLRFTWPEGSTPKGDIGYMWTCYPDQSALKGNSKSVVFTPKTSGEYKIQCTATVTTAANDPSSTFSVTAGPITANVKTFDFRLEGPAVVQAAGAASKGSLAATWDPEVDTSEENVKYVWSAFRNGSEVTTRVFSSSPKTGSAEFIPDVPGDYTIRCSSTRTVNKDDAGVAGREITKVASWKIRVGTSIKALTAMNGSNEVLDGAQIKVKTQVSVTADIEPSDASVKWTISGANWDSEPAENAKEVSFTPTEGSAGRTVSVTCTVDGAGGPVSKTMRFTVVDYVLTLTPQRADTSAGNRDAPFYTDELINISASLDSKPLEGTVKYIWPPVAGATTFDRVQSTASFQAKARGTYVVQCSVELWQTVNGETKKSEIARQKLNVKLVSKDAGNADWPDLLIRSSVPFTKDDAGNDEIKVAPNDHVQLSASWSKAPPQPVDETSIEWTQRSAGETGTAPQKGIQFKPNTRSEGTYDITCAAQGKERTITLTVTASPALLLQAEYVVNTSGTPELTDPLARGHEVTLTAQWTKDVPPSANRWYRWTCVSSIHGNITTRVVGYASPADSTQTEEEREKADKKVFEISRENGSSQATLRIPMDADENEVFTVSCTASGFDLPTSVTADLTAKHDFMVGKGLDENISTVSSSNLNEITQTSVTPVSAMRMLLREEAPILVENSPATGEQRIYGPIAAGNGAAGLTVGDVLDSFELSDDQDVVVLNEKGTERDRQALIGTGDDVQIKDNTRRDVLEQATVVVMGDMLGSGEMNLSQLVTMAKGLKDDTLLTGPYMEAGDWDENNRINLSDLVMQASMLKRSLIA